MYSEIVFVVFCFKCKSDDNLMNRKNIRFKLGIGARWRKGLSLPASLSICTCGH